jgi:leucyl-tRNA synthetase
MKVLIPFIPHLAYECLEQHGETETDKWPEIKNSIVLNEKIKIAIQINGKTREIIEIEKDLDEISAINESKKNKKVNDNLMNKKIIKTIFVKNRIINYLIK